MTLSRFKQWRVPSFSDPNKTHLVRLLLPSGEWRCSCPFFIFNETKMRASGHTPTCDHILKYKHKKLKYHGRNKKNR